MKVSKGGTTQRGIVRGGSQLEEVPLGQSQFVAVAGVEDAIQREREPGLTIKVLLIV